MKGSKVINQKWPKNATDENNKRYVDTVANSILDGSESFQGDINEDNHRVMNVHTPVSSSDELNKLLCETRYRKTTNNNKLLKISNDGRWDAKDKRMTGVAQAQ